MRAVTLGKPCMVGCLGITRQGRLSKDPPMLYYSIESGGSLDCLCGHVILDFCGVHWMDFFLLLETHGTLADGLLSAGKEQVHPTHFIG